VAGGLAGRPTRDRLRLHVQAVPQLGSRGARHHRHGSLGLNRHALHPKTPADVVAAYRELAGLDIRLAEPEESEIGARVGRPPGRLAGRV